MTVEQHKKEVIKAVDEFILDGLMFEDTSVGIYAIWELNQGVIDWINEEVEGFTVTEWTKETMTIECEGVEVRIQLVSKKIAEGTEFEDYDVYWNIVE